MNKEIHILLFLFMSITSCSQIDNVGSGRALQLDGIDDYIEIGDHYHDLNLPFTISAWVFLDPGYTQPHIIFVSNDTPLIYRGFWLTMTQNSIWCEFGDGAGGNNPAFRRGKIASVQNATGRWIHVCAVMKSATEFELYVNGFNVGGSPRGNSNLSMVSSAPGDVAKMGHFVSNVNVNYHYKGQIDEVRLWNKALTEADIRQTMCKKLTGNEQGLIGYWNFDETSGDIVYDKSSNHFDGVLKGNPKRVFSGAPIGDESIYTYAPNLNSISLTFPFPGNSLNVSGITGNPNGVHIYKVNNKPSQFGGLDPGTVSAPYFGVYLAEQTINNSFTAVYELNCDTYERKDNSESTWSKIQGIEFMDRVELISNLTQKPELKFSFGPDQIICDQNTVLLSSGLDPSGKTFQWNTGQTSSEIQVSVGGTYILSVKESCFVESDSIELTFEKTPAPINFGMDYSICGDFSKKLIIPDSIGTSIQWQDGTTNPTYSINDTGTYWVRVSNSCGVVADTITINKKVIDFEKIPNVITPGDGRFNETFILEDPLKGSNIWIYNRWGELIYESIDYQNTWDGEKHPAGIYFWKVDGPCFDTVKGIVHILR